MVRSLAIVKDIEHEIIAGGHSAGTLNAFLQQKQGYISRNTVSNFQVTFE